MQEKLMMVDSWAKLYSYVRRCISDQNNIWNLWHSSGLITKLKWIHNDVFIFWGVPLANILTKNSLWWAYGTAILVNYEWNCILNSYMHFWSEKYKLLKHETLDKKRPYWYCLLALNWRKVCSWVHLCSIAEVTETCR